MNFLEFLAAVAFVWGVRRWLVREVPPTISPEVGLSIRPEAGGIDTREALISDFGNIPDSHSQGHVGDCGSDGGYVRA